MNFSEVGNKAQETVSHVEEIGGKVLRNAAEHPIRTLAAFALLVGAFYLARGAFHEGEKLVQDPSSRNFETAVPLAAYTVGAYLLGRFALSLLTPRENVIKSTPASAGRRVR